MSDHVSRAADSERQTIPEVSSKSEEAIREWLVSYMSELLELDASEIDTGDPIASYGVDSSGAVGLLGDLSEWLGRKIDPALAYSYPTVDALSRFLAAEGVR